MSDVLVKGMEMPEGCVECPLLLAYGSRLENKIIHHCMGRLPEDSRFSDDADLTKRPKEGCPLVEVKPHGRLIDADAFIKQNKEGFKEPLMQGEDTIGIRVIPMDAVSRSIENAPTILEASE